MIKLNMMLLFSLVVCSMYLVHVQHENRLLFTKIAEEAALKSELELEGKRLLLQRQTYVAPTRVAVDAQKELDMRVPTYGVIEYMPQGEDELRHFEAQVPSNVRLIAEQEGGAHE